MYPNDPSENGQEQQLYNALLSSFTPTSKSATNMVINAVLQQQQQDMNPFFQMVQHLFELF